MREVFALDIAPAFQSAHSPCPVADTKARRLEQLIGIKEAELYALEELLRLQPHEGCAVEVMRPDLWVECLAQAGLVKRLCRPAAGEFCCVDLGRCVPPKRRRSQNLKNTGAFRADYLF